MTARPLVTEEPGGGRPGGPIVARLKVDEGASEVLGAFLPRQLELVDEIARGRLPCAFGDEACVLELSHRRVDERHARPTLLPPQEERIATRIRARHVRRSAAHVRHVILARVLDDGSMPHARVAEVVSREELDRLLGGVVRLVLHVTAEPLCHHPWGEAASGEPRRELACAVLVETALHH